MASANAPEYWASSGFDATLRAGFISGVDAARAFLGSAADVGGIFLESGGASDAVYEAARVAFCTHIERGGDSNCLKDDITKARAASHGSYYMTSSSLKCKCGHYVSGSVGLVTLAGPNDDASGMYDRAVHEYTHAVQMAMGGPLPNWLVEGGAVLNECILGTIKPSNGVAFSECLKFGGGGGGITQKTVELYTSGAAASGGVAALAGSTKFLTLYGSDRGCYPQNVPAFQQSNPLPDPEGSVGRKLWYDTGAAAILYAVYKANLNHAGSGGRTVVDFWTGKGSKGFWHAITPYVVDPVTGWASDVPEGLGWKKAFADFVGYATVAEFYADFEAAVRPNGAPITEAGILAWARADSEYVTYAQTVAGFGTRDPTAPPGGECTSGASAAAATSVAAMLAVAITVSLL
jgi:hypothetical protein